MKYYGCGTIDRAANEAIYSTMNTVADNISDMKEPMYYVLNFASGGDVPDAVEMAKELGADPKSVIVPAPTAGDIIKGSKGLMYFGLKVSGNRDVSAVEAATIVADKLRTLQNNLMEDKGFRDDNFMPPYPSANIGNMKYDANTNTVIIGAAYRNTPGLSQEHVSALVAQAVKETKSEIERMPSFPATHEGEQTAYELAITGIGKHAAHLDPGISAISPMIDLLLGMQKIKAAYPNVAIHVEEMNSGTSLRITPAQASLVVTLQGTEPDKKRAWADVTREITRINESLQPQIKTARENRKKAGEGDLKDRIGIRETRLERVPAMAISRSAATELAIEVRETATVPALSSQQGEVLDKILSVARRVYGPEAVARTSPFVTNANDFHVAYPKATTVVLGPGHETQSTEDADEYITRNQIRDCIDAYAGIVNELCVESPNKSWGKRVGKRQEKDTETQSHTGR